MDSEELLQLLETDESLAIANGEYICLIQPTGWPFFIILERFGGRWVINHENAEDWDIKGFFKLPDSGVAMNYVNRK